MPKVLVIEDEKPIRLLLSANLSNRDFQVDVAQSAEEGLDMLQQEQPDLLLLDIMLPGMNGWGVLEYMASEPTLADIPVIVLTGDETATEVDTSEYANLKQLISKPFRVTKVVEACRQVIDAA